MLLRAVAECAATYSPGRPAQGGSSNSIPRAATPACVLPGSLARYRAAPGGPKHPNAALLDSFYSAFSKRDGDAMAACYHPEARFSDPVFPDLRGEDIGRMWKMLCERGKDLTLEYSGIEAGDTSGVAHWEADYTFSTTGRKVHNIIDARFTFTDGLIATHQDDFGFWRWSRQALGAPGLLLGWTPIVQNKVRAEAAKGLAQYKKATS